jgi:lysyl-tRNA synthetase class 2
MGVMFAGLLLVSSSPFDANPDQDESKAAVFGVLASNLLFAVVTFLKGKPFLGTIAVFVSPVGWVAAIRLAKPASPWARWFYDPSRGRRPGWRTRKLRRSQRRFQRSRLERFERWFLDLIGGRAAVEP